MDALNPRPSRIAAPADDVAEVVEALESERCYRVLLGRDARFDGRFFVGVRTTGIFCRPICPAPTPKARNCTFWRSAAAAQAAGFRPCLRCRPEVAPGTPAWRGTAASVSRGLRLIEAGALDAGGSVESLADRLGIGPRHLRRLFDQHLGTTPRAVAQLRRVLFAKQLIDETSMPMNEISISAGFTSQRRFNACIRDVYGRPPSELRRGGPGGARPRRSDSGPHEIELCLSYRPPFAWEALLEFLRLRSIPTVELVEHGCYSRTFRSGDGVGWLSVTCERGKNRLRVGVYRPSIAGLVDVRTGLRQLFDLDADADAIDVVLGQTPLLTRNVATRPGMRVPGAFDGFETTVRAILGQQISVKGATTLAGRIAERWGEAVPATLGAPARLGRVFPGARALVEAPLEEIGLTRARATTIRGLAESVIADADLLAPGVGLEAQTTRWQRLTGFGPWTAHYVAMRVSREPDTLPSGDLGLRKAISGDAAKPSSAREVEKALEGCRPYRAYAAMRLWSELTDV